MIYGKCGSVWIEGELEVVSLPPKRKPLSAEVYSGDVRTVVVQGEDTPPLSSLLDKEGGGE